MRIPVLLGMVACASDMPLQTTQVEPGTSPSAPTRPTTNADGQVTLGALVFDGGLPRNLLVVSLDTTRRDAIGRFSGTTDTPELDAFLQSAFVLEDHRSCSNWTAPAMTCVVSGRNPMENGFWTWSDDPNVPGKPSPSYKTLANHLTDAGWATTLVTGSEVFSSDTGITGDYAREVREDWVPAPWVAESALHEAATLQAHAEVPWFLHVHFIDPHGSYCAPDEFVETGDLPDIGLDVMATCDDPEADPYAADSDIRADDEIWREDLADTYRELYAGEVRYWDQEFGRFWNALDASGALDDTLVVFVTDHGQQFFEHGSHGHGRYLGSEENRATAAFWAKNLRPGVWAEPTVHQDLAQTLFAMVGVAPELPTSGLVVGTAGADRTIRAMDYMAGALRLSVVKDDRQLLYDWWGERALYRLDVDPDGLEDVYDPADPDVVALWSDMDTWVADVRSAWPHLDPPVAAGP